MNDKALQKQYFKEARGWDAEISVRIKKSEQRAWLCCLLFTLIAVLQGIGLVCLLPLKSIEPFVIRVDNNSGLVDVVSTLSSHGQVKQQAQEVLDKYWLAQYVRHREGYQWETRSYNRKLVGLMSADDVQQEFAAQTDPKTNPQAPIVIYDQQAQVNTKINAISFIAKDKVNSEQRITTLVRYSKKLKRVGENHPLTHWVATITFVYRNAPMSLQDRQLNPLGFQVLSYRNDQATGGD
ncbi:Type IV secretory pathway component [Parashewanella spongiae]|uniref:Type IV secretory pathway component n=1 Tax=Parashewanella spongiae TaxID=342950 RepID=A0A3A6TCF9_9GAMM|nr:VirB8/TrbF family protein [Parashewanella spongiae]MCL1079446.1 Type IV secretory pathway component [Parashewanella spongiae]RJY07558.1 Type IV secretory pathway component [Parashewanella spongiae]